MSKAILSREAKAQALIEQGAVRLHPGKGYAVVRGETGTYTVTRRDGCNCPDAKRRDPRNCKHAIATRILCGLYRECAAKARAGETVRIPADLVAAIGGVAVEASASVPVPPTCTRCGLSEVNVGYVGGVCHECRAARAAKVAELDALLFGTAA